MQKKAWINNETQGGGGGGGQEQGEVVGGRGRRRPRCVVWSSPYISAIMPENFNAHVNNKHQLFLNIKQRSVEHLMIRIAALAAEWLDLILTEVVASIISFVRVQKFSNFHWQFDNECLINCQSYLLIIFKISVTVNRSGNLTRSEFWLETKKWRQAIPIEELVMSVC